MRASLLAALLLLPSLVVAQVPETPQFGRPDFAVTGRETMPQFLLDEAALAHDRFERIELPAVFWEEMRACLATTTNLPTPNAGERPTILVIPVARTFRVHDMTIDSLNYADDSTYKGENWSSPTVGYALVRTNVILLASRFRANKYVLRHEALHFLLWREKQILGHPKEYFGPCDEYYE